jgi:hypothetical protein
MALLTEEQVEDVMAMFDCYASGRYKKSFEYDFGEWNTKQTTQQIGVDWNDAPKNATKAALRLHWITESEGSVLWSHSFCSVTFERPAPVITPHPHAEIMAKYAEVAARRVDPWSEFDVKFEYGNWDRCTKCISFSLGGIYRYIGDDK